MTTPWVLEAFSSVRHTEHVIALRLALAQVNTTVGDLEGNAEIVLARTAQAAAAGAHLVAFPEMMLTGYPVEDLVFRPAFREASRAAVDKLAVSLAEAGLGDTAVVVGYLDFDVWPRNAAAFLLGGRVMARYYKHFLPNYGVFDERRYFTPGVELAVVRHLGVDIAITICEDLWRDHQGGPFTVAKAAGVGLVVNINGSPFEPHKEDVRHALMTKRTAEVGAPIAYVNLVGAQDELSFDGDSMVMDADGTMLMRAPQFVEDVFLADVPIAEAPTVTAPVLGETLTVTRVTTALPPLEPYEMTERQVAPRRPVAEMTWTALVVGLRDYVRKNGFRSVVIAVSGGIDSAVVAAIAADAIGGENVYGISMPSAYSSEHSMSDAEDLACRIGAHYRTVPIKPMVDAFVDSLGLTGVAEENIQARVRGMTLMAASNAEGHLVLATGNKSELAVGYSTIYGDAVGGFAPLKDVPKTFVWALARWRNEQAESLGLTPPIPPNSITKEPSAELRPGQLDSDTLPDYNVLDAILWRYVDRDQAVADIVAEGFDPETVRKVARMIDAAEWKRRQYPQGTKITTKAFGKDRRMPVTNRWNSAD